MFTSIIQLLDNFPDETSCKAKFEEIRWNGTPKCPYCFHEKIWRYNNGKTLKCAQCKTRFSVTIGTIFEESLLPLRTWFLAIYLLISHKKGISSLQLAKHVGVTQKTAWFMLHRIRYMCQHSDGFMQFTDVVEVDETYIGGRPRRGKFGVDADGKRIRSKRGRGTSKTAVVGIVQRGKGIVVVPVKSADRETLHNLIKIHVAPGTKVMTDEYRPYRGLGRHGYKHGSINHSVCQYADGDIHTNTIEGFWSILKRGWVGT